MSQQLVYVEKTMTIIRYVEASVQSGYVTYFPLESFQNIEQKFQEVGESLVSIPSGKN